jgi:plastocyanin
MKSSIFLGSLLLLLAACSKDNSSDNNNNSGGNLNTISMKNSAFSPPSLQVNINATVTWINDDNMVHTVAAGNGSFDSGDIAPGSKFTYTFTNTGTYNYSCIHHSGMTGVVIVAGIR